MKVIFLVSLLLSSCACIPAKQDPAADLAERLAKRAAYFDVHPGRP